MKLHSVKSSAGLTLVMSVQLIIVVAALFSSRFADAKPSAIHCGANEFFSYTVPTSTSGLEVGATTRSKTNGGIMRCMPCSVCPSNQIVRRPCSKLSDTVCGPLYDFEFFNAVPSVIQNLPVTSSPYRTPPGAASHDVTGRQRLGKLLRGWRPRGASSEEFQQVASDRDDSVLLSVTRGYPAPMKDHGIRLMQCFSDEWSLLCYGVVFGMPATMLLIAIALAMFVYRPWYISFNRRKPNVRDVNNESRRHQPLLVARHANAGNAITSSSGNRCVRHLETQLQRQRGVASGRHPVRAANDYVDLRTWFRSIRVNGAIPDWSSTVSSGRDDLVARVHSTSTADRSDTSFDV